MASVATPDLIAYGLAHDVTRYRLAIEVAAAAIRLGKVSEALAALDDVRPEAGYQPQAREVIDVSHREAYLQLARGA